MRGSIQKKGRIYYAVVAVGLKRKWFKGGTTKKEAEKVLTDKLGDIDKVHIKIFLKQPSRNIASFGLECT